MCLFSKFIIQFQVDFKTEKKYKIQINLSIFTSITHFTVKVQRGLRMGLEGTLFISWRCNVTQMSRITNGVV